MKHAVDETWNSFHLTRFFPHLFWMDMLTRSVSSPNNHYTQICNFFIIKITALLSLLSYWTDGYMWNVQRITSSRAGEREEKKLKSRDEGEIIEFFGVWWRQINGQYLTPEARKMII